MTRVPAIGAALLAIMACGPALAQQAQRPPTEVTKVDGTDNVYIWRNQNAQSIFIVTRDGVIATDPISYGKPDGGKQYVDAIKKITDKPIKFLIYSHVHFDHIAGGKAFKDAGARIIAHRNATARLKVVQDPATPVPDESVGNKKVIKLGGTTLELNYVGANHSDSTLVMRLPKEKIIFVVDLIAVGTFPARGMIDFYPLEAEDSIKKIIAMDWERLIPGHPGVPNSRLGTKDDAQKALTLLQEASADIKKLAREGKCWDAVEKEYRMPKYESIPGYANGLPFLARRYCGLWGRGS